MSIKELKQREKTWFQYNFTELIEKLIPQVYLNQDIIDAGTESSLTYEIISKVAKLATEFNTILSATDFDTSGSINRLFDVRETFAVIYPETVFQKLFRTEAYFMDRRWGKLTLASAVEKWELDTLQYYEDVNGGHHLAEYLEFHVLPKFELNNPTIASLSKVDPSVVDKATAINYLFNNFGWIYILNTLSVYDKYALYATPRSLLAKKLVSTIFEGKPFYLHHGIQILFEFLWSAGKVS